MSDSQDKPETELSAKDAGENCGTEGRSVGSNCADDLAAGARLRLTAYHEAGHAVVADALSFDVGTVSILPDVEHGRLGVAYHSEVTVSTDAHDSEWRQQHQEAIQVCLAGLAAECILDPDGWIPETATLDLDEALEIASGLAGRPATEADLAPYREATDRLLRDRWHAVRVLAEKLLLLGRLHDVYGVIVQALDLGPSVQVDEVLSEDELRARYGF